MTAKRTPPVRRAPAPKQKGFLDYLEKPSAKMVAAAAAITAGLYLWGAFKPVIDSGPLPIPSRAEVDSLRTDLHDHTDALKKGLDATLETAKAANVAAQQAIQQTNDYRLDRLLQQKIQLEDALKKNPGDAALRQTLAKTEIDIENLNSRPAAPPMP